MKSFLTSNKLTNIAGAFWCLALGIITFDRIFTYKVFGFTVKSFYWLFLCSFIILAFQEFKKNGFKKTIQDISHFILATPWKYLVFILLYSSVCSFFTPIPIKSIGYTFLGWFDLFAIIVTAYWLAQRFSNQKIQQTLYLVLATAIIFLSVVVITDHIVYFFEIPDGLFGFNQDTLFQIHVSRPHAFAYEPSYLATYFSVALIFVFYDLVFSKKKMLSKQFSSLALFLGGVCLTILMSRSGIISFVLGIFLILLFFLKRLRGGFRFPWRIFAAVFMVFILIYFVTPKQQREGIYDFFIAPLVTLKASSGTARLRSMWMGYQICKETKLVGAGTGMSFFYWVSQKQEPPPAREIDEVIEAGTLKPEFFNSQAIMSTWSEILGEQGIFGFLMYLCFAISIVYELYKKTKIDIYSGVTPAFISALVFFVFTAHWLPNFFRADVWVWYAVWGHYLGLRK